MADKPCCERHGTDHTGKGWWLDRCTDFDWMPGEAERTDLLLMFDNYFICHIGRSRRADRMVPALVRALNKAKIEIEMLGA